MGLDHNFEAFFRLAKEKCTGLGVAGNFIKDLQLLVVESDTCSLRSDALGIKAMH
jgi:hypothetical protein